MNKIYNENCLETMARLKDCSIDMTLTSPPYDNLRNYNGYSFEFHKIAGELYRVTRQGGVVIWIVGDSTIKGCESGSSFMQALYFKSIGFNLHDTMIFHKKAVGSCGSRYSYSQAFEYMFVFSKGKIKTFNPIKDLVPIRAGQSTSYVKSKSIASGYISETRNKVTPMASKRQNVWSYSVSFGGGNDKTGHPAVFLEKLANDHILSWSNPGDLIYDPFMGSGTTAKMALLNGRSFLGSELSEEYCHIANNRIAHLIKDRLSFDATSQI